MVDLTFDRLQALVEDGTDWRAVKMHLRFLSSLANANVVHPDLLFKVFQSLLNEVEAEFISESISPLRAARANVLLYLVLATLPWCGTMLIKERQDEEVKLLEKIQICMELRPNLIKNGVMVLPRHAFSQLSSTDPVRDEETGRDWQNNPVAILYAEDRLDSIYKLILIARKTYYETGHTLRPYEELEQPLLLAARYRFTDEEDNPRIFNVPSWRDKAPDDASIGVFNTMLTPMLKLFKNSDLLSEGLTGLDRFLFEEYVQDIMSFFSSDPIEGAEKLEYLPFEKLPFHALIEIFFTELFKMPHQDIQIVSFTRYLVEMIWKHHKELPSILARGVISIYGRIDELHPHCKLRMVSWLAHQMSHFQYKWPWTSPVWTNVSDLYIEDPQRIFTEEVLEHCLRLSYHKRLERTVPISYVIDKILPEDPEPLFSYGERLILSEEEINEDVRDNQVDATPELISLGNEIIDYITRKKANGTVMLDMLLSTQVDGFLGGDVALKLHVFTQVLLVCGFKSLSHLAVYTERYKYVFEHFDQELGGSKDIVMRGLGQVLRRTPGRLVMVASRWLPLGIISASSVVDWVFSPRRRRHWNRVWIWELLYNAVSQTLYRVAGDEETAQDRIQDLFTMIYTGMASVIKNLEMRGLDVDSNKLRAHAFLGHVEVFGVKFRPDYLTRSMGAAVYASLEEWIRLEADEGAVFDDLLSAASRSLL